MTAREVSDILGFSVNALLRWEKGEAQPRSSSLIRLARFYSCSPDYLLNLTDERNGKAIAREQ